MHIIKDNRHAPIATIAAIRAAFPALDRIHIGQLVAYFDGPGGTQVPRAVGDAVTNYLFHHNANTDWAYPTSAETDAAIAYAREASADFLNAAPEEIIFGANMTTLTFHLSRAIARDLKPGDEIVVTELDHHANIDPWHEAADDRDLVVRTARLVPETGQLDWDHFASQLTSRTKLVAVGAASNALGTITDVKRAVTMAHDAGALAFVDAVHFAPHNLLDVRDLDCDFLACSAYKFYGPHIGVLYARRPLLDSLRFPRLRPAHGTSPERAETGTLNHEGIVGAAAAIDFLASLAGSDASRRERLSEVFDELHNRGARLINKLHPALAAIHGVTLYGPPPDVARTPTLAFTVAGMHAREVATFLATRGIFVSHGDFYAATVVERLGKSAEGLVRAGCAMYTTFEETTRLADAIEECATASRARVVHPPAS
ncbi:MAG: cysteine desulfurase-like protein [Gemmatimonadaceae bacterium]